MTWSISRKYNLTHRLVSGSRHNRREWEESWRGWHPPPRPHSSTLQQHYTRFNLGLWIRIRIHFSHQDPDSHWKGKFYNKNLKNGRKLVINCNFIQIFPVNQTTENSSWDNFLQFIKLDLNPHWEKLLDAHPQKMNAEPQPWFNLSKTLA